MTTFVGFVPTTIQPFSFQPTLDGQVYLAVVRWGLWGQRWYVFLYANSGPRVFTLPLIESVDPVTRTLTTTRGLYTAQVNSAAGLLPAMAVAGANLAAGTAIAAVRGTTVRLSQPAALTGVDQSAVCNLDFNLLAGYGFSSTLVYRLSSQQFEIT